MSDELNTIMDMGLIYPTENKLISFLDKVYSIPFSNPGGWEKEIINFFRENPFVVYIIYRSTEDRYEEYANDIKYSMMGQDQRVAVMDTEELFKSLIKIRETVNIDKKMLKKYIEWLFNISRLYRQMFSKVVDSEDSGFKNYKCTYFPSSYELTMNLNDKPLKLFEQAFIICADGNIEYNFEVLSKEVHSNFDRRLRELAPKDKTIKKRRPLDSRLRHECFKRDNYRCKECGATNKEKMLHADHIVPVAQGGTDELSNLQTLCDNCNSAKSDKHFVGGKLTDGTN